MMFADLAIKKLIEEYRFKTVLDIGCGKGEHLGVFRHANKAVAGIDLLQGRDFMKEEINDIYDCVWCSHVLEHQLDVHSFLKKVHSVLKEGGILAITVPPLKNQIVGGHVSLWNAGLLLYRLVLAGFDCSEASVLEYGYNISVIIRKKTIEVPPLKYDSGDINAIKDYLPQVEFTIDSFNGSIPYFNWEAKKVIFWGYKYPDMKGTWRRQAIWLANAFAKEGFVVVRHHSFNCEGFPGRLYDHKFDNPCDIVIYNHTDQSEIVGPVIKADRTFFMKPTIPDEIHTSLDSLGYGPYSTVAYKEPHFNGTSQKVIDNFFGTKVKKWIETKITKWPLFENQVQEIKDKDYFLVIGQCEGDETTNRYDFGSHADRLGFICKELARISEKRIIVKLHPYFDGIKENKMELSKAVKGKLEAISSQIKVFIGKLNIHSFIKNAYCVLLSNSGAGYEAMMHHKPIISWGHPEYHWVTYDLRHLADLHRAIKLDWFDSIKQDRFLYWYLEKYCYYNQETANRRVEELLKEQP